MSEHFESPREEYLCVNLGPTYYKGELIEGGTSISMNPIGKERIVINGRGEKMPVDKIVAVIGGAPLLDVVNLLKEGDRNPFFLIIDPLAQELGGRIIRELVSERSGRYDGIQEALLIHYGEDLNLANKWEEIRKAYGNLGRLLSSTNAILQLVPFTVENILSLLERSGVVEVVDSVVCLHPSIILPVPKVVQLAERMLVPGGELIIQTESLEIASIAIESLKSSRRFIPDVFKGDITSIFSLAYPRIEKLYRILWRKRFKDSIF